MIFKCKNCGTSDNKHAKELCEKCYHKKWFNEYCVKQEVKKRQMDYNKNWRRKNPERVKELRRKWDKENPEKKKEMDKKYREENRDRLLRQKREYSQRLDVKERRRKSGYGKRYYHRKIKDPTWRLNHNIHIEVWRDLKKNKRNINWEKLVGYTKEDLIKHLESQFIIGMTWENYGSYWEIDHIIPRSAFNFTSPDDSQFKFCWSLNNLQPLECSKNRSKGNKIKFGEPFYK